MAQILLHEMCDQMVLDIDNGLIDIESFKSETLFINIYFCFYFIKFLSLYYNWGERLIKILKKNIRRKWSKSLPNIDFFIKEMEQRRGDVDPFDYYYKSEDYFEKLIYLKPISNILFPPLKKKKKKRNKNFKKVLIR